MKMASIEIYVQGKNGVEHTFEIDFDYTIGNDGIGPYEYWGCRGYDHGTDYLEDVEISSIRLVRETPVFNADGHRRYKRSLRAIDKEKLNAVSLEDIENEIRDNFDWQDDIEGRRYEFQLSQYESQFEREF